MWAWVAVAWAGEVPEGVRPVVAAVDLPERYAVWRLAEGLPPDELACQSFWPGAALLCFRVWEGSERRWVGTTDLARWGVDRQGLEDAMRSRAEAHQGGLEVVPVEGMSATYLRWVDGDGWAAGGLLRPDLLAAKLGGTPVRVSMPAEGVLVAWRPAGLDLDRVMAVGARELFETQKGSVSPLVFQWDGKGWLPFGEAVPQAPK